MSDFFYGKLDEEMHSDTFNNMKEKDREALKKGPKKMFMREDKLLGQVNIKARQLGLKPPNNKESIEYEKTHCISCGSKHHNPKAYLGLDINYLKVLEKLNQESLGMLCCGCFSRIKTSNKLVEVKTEITKRDRMMVYNPLEADKIPTEEILRIKFNIKQGDDVSREQSMVDMFIGRYSSRYG